MGLTTNVALSGNVIVNGNSTPFTGTGTLTFARAVSATFNNSAALAQTETISGTVTAAGQSAPFSSMETDYYASNNGAVLGQSTTNEYDVVQSPFTYPISVVGGSAGNLGTLSLLLGQHHGRFPWHHADKLRRTATVALPAPSRCSSRTKFTTRRTRLLRPT